MDKKECIVGGILSQETIKHQDGYLIYIADIKINDASLRDYLTSPPPWLSIDHRNI